MARPRPARVERARERLGVEVGRVDRGLQVEAEDRRARGRRAATTGPAGRRRACRARDTGRRRAGRASARASSAAACPARVLFGSPSSSQNIWPRVPRQKPSSGTTGELESQPPLGVAETRFPNRSATSTWQVSPVPARRVAEARRARRLRDPREPGLAAAGGAGPELAGRLVSHERAPLARVLRRQQRLERHVGEGGIAVPGLAVGEGELGALDDGVDVARASRARARRGRSLRAGAAAGGRPAPGSTGPPSAPCGPRSRRRAAPPSSRSSRRGRRR